MDTVLLLEPQLHPLFSINFAPANHFCLQIHSLIFKTMNLDSIPRHFGLNRTQIIVSSLGHISSMSFKTLPSNGTVMIGFYI